MCGERGGEGEGKEMGEGTVEGEGASVGKEREREGCKARNQSERQCTATVQASAQDREGGGTRGTRKARAVRAASRGGESRAGGLVSWGSPAVLPFVTGTHFRDLGRDRCDRCGQPQALELIMIIGKLIPSHWHGPA